MSAPSKAMQERMMPDIENMVSMPYTPGMTMPDWRNFATVKLSDGSTVSLAEFGEPPPDVDQDEWYAERDEDLVHANLRGEQDAAQ